MSGSARTEYLYFLGPMLTLHADELKNDFNMLLQRLQLLPYSFFFSPPLSGTSFDTELNQNSCGVWSSFCR